MASVVMADDGIAFDGAMAESAPLGGAETAFVALAEALAGRGHRVEVRNRCAAALTHNGVRWAPLSADTATFNGQPIESVRRSQFRADPKARGTACHAACAQLAEQSSTLLDNHPRIKELRAQIADLDGQIRPRRRPSRVRSRDAKLAGARVDVADRDPRSAQEPGGVHQRARRAIARAWNATRNRSAICWNPISAKYREATFARHHQFGAGRCPHRFRATVSNVPAYPKKLPTVLIATFRDADAQLRLRAHQGNSRGAGALRCRSGVRRRWSGPRDEPHCPRTRRGGNAVIGARASPPRSSAEIPTTAAADAATILHRMGARRIAVFGAAPGMNISQAADQAGAGAGGGVARYSRRACAQARPRSAPFPTSRQPMALRNWRVAWRRSATSSPRTGCRRCT